MLIATVTQPLVKVATTTPATTISAVNKVATVSATLSNLFGKLPFYLLNLLFFGYFIFLWFFLVRWVGTDAQRRGILASRRRYYQLLVLIFNFPGLLLYLLWRPPLTLDEEERFKMEEDILKLELEKLRREAAEGHV